MPKKLSKKSKKKATQKIPKPPSLTPNMKARVQAYNKRGIMLAGQNKLAEAAQCFQQALQYNPNEALTHNNLGIIFSKQNQFDKAVACYQRAIELKPNYPAAFQNLGNSLKEQGKLNEAAHAYQQAIIFNPNHALIQLNYSLVLLKMGDFTTGWEKFEWRLKSKEVKTPQLKKPLWDGSELGGRRLLVHWEQGIGDSIQFVRYLHLIKNATVIFAGQSALKELFANLPGIDIFIVNLIHQEPEIPYDVWIPLLSLPKIFATTLDNIPVCVPYLYPDSKKVEIWRNRLANDRFKIGIVWAGNPQHSNDRNRSCPLIHFAALAKLSHLTLFSLQKGKAATQPTPEGMELISLTEELDNFTDTAAAIAGLDLVISVDTAVAHLAGAMGYPVWVLLPYDSDWRWFEHREDSPWYPTMRLFRQPSPGDWDSVFNQVVNELGSYYIN